MVEAFLINPPKSLNRKRKRNPLAEEALILGGLNPRRKKTNYWPNNSAGHSAAAKKGWITRRKKRNKPTAKGAVVSMAKRKAKPKKRGRKRSNPLALRNNYALNPRRKRARGYRRNYALNPRRKRARRYRRNPAMVGRAVNLRKPQTLVMPIITGVIAKMAADRIPPMLKLTGNMANMAQLGIGIAGGMFLQPMLGSTGAVIWLAVCGSTALTNFINTMMLKGLEDDELIYTDDSDELNAYPENENDVMGMDAYPELEGLSAYPEEV